jgi:hypothetical protein
VLASTIIGCSHVARPPLEKEMTRHDEPPGERPWLKVVGYTSRDGVRHRLAGYAWFDEESLRIYSTMPERREAGTWVRNADLQPIAYLSRADVERLHVRRFSWWKTALLIAIPGAILGIGAATTESITVIQ